MDVFFYNILNFGDQLNRVIFKGDVEGHVRWTPFERSEIIGIGSIAEEIIGKKINDIPVKVFSTGFMTNHNEKINELKRPVDVIAVRGNMTLNIMASISNVNKSLIPIVADGGLLAVDYINWMIEKKYKLGIVPHVLEKNSKELMILKNSISDSIIINLEKQPMSVLKKISECEYIISTALHPLIIADSLGIPNAWMQLTNTKGLLGEFKFNDYYSAFGLKKKPINIDSIKQDLINYIKSEYNIPYEQVKIKQAELRKAKKNIIAENQESIIIRNQRRSNTLYFLSHPYVGWGRAKCVINKMKNKI